MAHIHVKFIEESISFFERFGFFLFVRRLGPLGLRSPGLRLVAAVLVRLTLRAFRTFLAEVPLG
eukprot:2140307-Pyramimonas_sp.AAC.1